MPTTYYSCTTVGCSATTTVTMHTTLQSCQDGCRRWGCSANVINEDTNIYVFYDISSMDSSWLQNAYAAVNDWVASGIPGFTGNIYHTLDHRERWLEYDYIIYSGNVAGDLTWAGGQPQTILNWLTETPYRGLAWKQLEINNGATGWYDLFHPSTTFTVPSTATYPIYSGTVINPTGLPPTSDYSDNVLVITFNDESSPQYHDAYTLGWLTQPTSEWIDDYDNYTGSTWTGVQNAGGTLNQFLMVASSGDTTVPQAGLLTFCSDATPCIAGPAWYWTYCDMDQALLGNLNVVAGMEQITSTFTNSNGAVVQGCTGMFGSNPCPPSWQTGYTFCGGLFAPDLRFAGYALQFADNAKNHALQVTASIDSGNQTNLDGTWQVGTAPMLSTNLNYAPTSNLSNIVNMGYGISYNVNQPNLENENPYWVDSSNNMINLSSVPNPVAPIPNKGGLDQYGFGYNVEALPFTGPNLANAINNFLSQGFTAQTLCTSAITSNQTLFPYTTWDDCNESDGCGKYTCAATGCIPWSTGPYDSLSSCTASCFSQECRASGCTQIVGSGGTHYSQSIINTDVDALLGSITIPTTGGAPGMYANVQLNLAGYIVPTQQVLATVGLDATGNITTITVTNNNLTVNPYAGQIMTINAGGSPSGSGLPSGAGLASFQLTAGDIVTSINLQDQLTACTASCVSYNCTSTGCVERVGSGGTFQTSGSCTATCVSWNCTDDGCTTFPGSGNTPYATSATCSAACVSYNCTPTGCVERAGTGGTYVELVHCTTACTSYFCTDSGCTEQIGTGGTFSTNQACTASCTSYVCSDTGCTQTAGSGGTYFSSGQTQDSYTACTASCTSYNCVDSGCTQIAGSGGTYWNSVNPTTAHFNCTGNCTSWNCTPTGCVERAGTGGQYVNYNACSAACYSYNCTPTGCQISGGTGSTYSSLGLCQVPCISWDCESSGCIQQQGTGSTHLIYTNCTSGCTSWDCAASGCTERGGTGGTYSSVTICTATCSSYTCTDTGCTVQIGSGGTYYNSGNTAQDALTACTASCRSWNCTNTGCVERSGPGGNFPSLNDCNTGCTSWECRASGCTQIVGSGSSPTYNACTATCSSWSCSDLGCTEQAGSGGTFSSQVICDNECKSFNCTDSGCTQLVGTGGTFSTDVQCATACTSYYCTITGCTLQYGTGGTFTDLNDCSSACTSFECRDSGCTEVVGTGSTDASSACTSTCKSYNCSDTGCVVITGSGGTFYNAASLQDSLTACTASCTSFFCTNSGCTEQNGTGGTYSTSASCTATCVSWNCSTTGCVELVGTGGTFILESHCTTACTSYFCTDSGCTEQIGTGATYSTSAACTASCVSYGCSDSGCAQQIGSGATHFDPDSVQDALTACTASCVSWNCTDSGCTEVTGTGGTFSTQAHCLTACTSWFCTVTGCTEQAGSGGTYANSGLCATDGACVSYYCMDTGCTQVAGTGGTVNSSGACTASCTTWNCTDSGCTETQGTGGTYATQAHCITACTSFFCTDSGCTEQIGTGGTYSTSAACTASCSSFYCTPYGCTEQTGTGGTFSSTGTCTASCQSYNCSDNGCVVQTGTGGTYYRASGLQDSLTACTASCYSYQCSDSGCNKVTGSGGTHYNIAYPWHAQTACTASCVSWDCGPSGVVSGPNNSACIEQVGTGSTWTIEQDCVLNCQSWSCGDSGCEYAAGSGGTWYYLNDPSLSQTNCAIHCWSWWCDTIGCQDEPGSGQTFYVTNSGDIGFDNVYAAHTACTEDCQSWSCTTQSGLVGPSGQPTACLQIPGTGATNTDINFNGCYTACTSYDCGPQGCYLATGGQGQYFDIQVCETACMSWQCTDTGCELLEGNTGTTTEIPCATACTSWDCTDIGCLQRPGLGGQHLTEQSCTASCKSWFCDNTSCTEQQGSGATFDALSSCTYDCQSWNCESYGCSQQVGTGATHETSAICSTACTSWMCNDGWGNSYCNSGVLGCCELSGTGWTHSSLVDCTGSCTSYLCEEYPTGCTAIPGLTGYPQVICDTCHVWFCGGIDDPVGQQGCYKVPGNPWLGNNGNFHYTNLQDCQDACKSYECLSTGCTQYPETGHTYATDIACAIACQSWGCSGTGQSYGCHQAPFTGLTWTSATDCDCFSWDCGPTGCIAIPGAGGAYTAETACTQVCLSYNCSDTGCIVLTGNSGSFASTTTCSANCISYNCEPMGCVQHTGTGGTFTDLASCNTGCTSWECLKWNGPTPGCVEYPGTGHTYPTNQACTGICNSWECTQAGVIKHAGTGHTFNSYASATGMCLSYNCEATYLGDPVDGCVVNNPAPSWFTMHNGAYPYDSGYWGTAGAHDSMSSCTANCIHWGCNHIAITQFAKVYVYYDITSMGATVLEEAYDRVTDWVSSIPGWSGETYHILTQSQERWLALPVITFSGRSFDYRSNHYIPPNCDPDQLTFAEFPFGANANVKVSKSLTWAANTQAGLDGNFYDTGISGSCSPPQNFTYFGGYLNGISFSNHISCYQGPPPTADTNTDVINIIFLDEANKAYHSYHETYGLTYPSFWPDQLNTSTTDGWNYVPSWSTTGQMMNRAPQPTHNFRYDYERYMEVWTTVTGTTSGSVRNYFYPRPAGSLRMYNQELALNAFASIHSGNKVVEDGMWQPGTYPHPQGSTTNTTIPPYYCKANLVMLESMNPYTTNYTGVHYDYDDLVNTGNTIHWSSDTMTGGVGHLDRFGWGINITLGNFYTQTFYDDMNAFLTASTAGNFVIGCVSAETQQTYQYPYASASGCSSGCTGLSCSDYGCVLGSVDQFTSSVVCSAACQSYNCEINGCVWQYGTGGTFYNATDGTYGLADCQAYCNSYNCVDSLSLANPTDQGCEMIIGTGGTFVDYTACTASCQSWNCECDCTISTPLSAMTACTNIPNTGGTYLTLTSCTATCTTGASWYCSGETVDAFGTVISPCYVFCGNGGYYSDGVTPIPMSLVFGPWSTSGAANSVCCGPTTSWNCTGTTLVNSCLNRTLIPGTYVSGGDALNWFTSFLPSNGMSGFSYESTTPAYNINECAGPNGGIMYELWGVAHTNINGGTFYGNWNSFVSACISAGLSTIVLGMNFTTVNAILYSTFSDYITIFEEPCYCEDETCGCEEIQGPGGTYSAQTACTATCCTASTSWNCIQDQYQPICNTKPSIGTVFAPINAMDHFRQFNPTGIFALSKFYPYYNTVGAPVNVPWATAWANTIGQGQSTPEDCYKKVLDPNIPNTATFIPSTYIESISHPMISGGTPFYTWQTFLDSILAAGVTGVNNATSVSSACYALDLQLSPWFSFQCNIITKPCCSSDDCYCYELFTTGGTYNTLPDCNVACCPLNTGFTCDQASTCIGPIPFSNVYTNWFGGAGAQSNCLAFCSGTTTWDCVQSSITGTCDDAQYGEFPPTSLAFQLSTIAYPFGTCAITNPWGLPGVVEKVLTDNTYMNPNWAFSSVTWELSTIPVLIPPVPNPCLGVNHQALYRLMSLASPSVDTGTMYYSWGSFISAAIADGYGVSTSQNITDLSTLFDFEMKIEACACDTAPCHCIEVFGSTGFYQSSGLCMNNCCNIDSWNCTINGCEDPGNGTGVYTVLIDCETDCEEWLCGAAIPPNHVDGKIASGVVGSQVDQAIYLVNTVATNVPFSDYMYEDHNYPQGGTCVGNSGYPWRFVTAIFVPLGTAGQPIVTPQLTTWDSFIGYLNTTYSWLAVTNTMAYQTVDSIIQSNNNGYGIKVASSDCVCQTLPCDCHTVPGTGHTGGYHITQYSICEQTCCSGVCLDDCGVLLVGRNHGVSVYDYQTNTAIQLFHPTNQGFEISDIAAGHDLIWLVNEDSLEIEEHRILSHCPFQSVFNRTIEVGIDLGKGLAPTNVPTKLIGNAAGKIIMLEISVSPVPPTNIQVLFNLPTYAGGATSTVVNPSNMPPIGEQYIVTGDILYDWNTGTMLILYGYGSYVDMWIGEFDMAGNQLQAFHITAGIPAYDYFTGVFEDAQTGRKYAVTRDGIVSEIQVSPFLAILPPTQQIPPYYAPSGSLIPVVVNGGTNVVPVGGSQDCISLLVPITYNCKISAGGCVDPKDGTGEYSVFNGAESAEAALAQCKSSCISNTWDCNSTVEVSDAPTGTGYELPSSVTDDLTAYDYIAQTPSLHNVNFEDIFFQNDGVTTVNSSLSNTDLANQPCWPTYTDGWKYSLDSIEIIPSNITVSTWGELITNLIAAGVTTIDSTSTRYEVYNNSSIFFNVTLPFTQNTKARTCFKATCECVEVTGSEGFYSTSGQCVDACCPTYNCTPDGCLDPQDGSGSFKGVDGLTLCQEDCKELLCVTSQPITDSCVGKTIAPFSYTPYTESYWRVLSYFADPVNSLQQTNFINYKWVQQYPVGTVLPGHCDNSMLTHPAGLESFWVHYNNQFTWMTNISLGWPFNTTVAVSAGTFTADKWSDIITYAQNNGCPTVSLTMTYDQAKAEMEDVCGVSFGFTNDYCKCTYTNCGCQEVIGTGHTGAYPIGSQDICDSNCCPTDIVINQARMGLIDELDKIIYESTEEITTNVDAAIEKLNNLIAEGKTGDDCQYCNNNKGVCLYNGCLDKKGSGDDDQYIWVFPSPNGPTGPSYNCYSSGCFLVWWGGYGQFNGTQAYQNCRDACVSYNCIPGIIEDDCEEMIKLGAVGGASDALTILANKDNGYQTEEFNKFKYEEVVSDRPDNACVTPEGNVYSKISTIKATDWSGERTIVNNVSTWSNFISELSRTGYEVTDDMSYNNVVQQGELASEKFKIKVNQSYCMCSGQPCHCVDVIGTGGTGTYPTLTLCNQAANTNPCCVVDANSYNCTINGCQQHLGVGVGTYSSAYALWECEQECVAWGCQDIQLSLSTATTVVTPQTTTAITVTTGMSSADTVIHVWYDTSSMSSTLLNTAQSAINQWIVQEQLPGGVLDGWQGLVYHQYSSGEDWVKWPGYSINHWGGNQGTFNPANYAGATYKNILVISLIDESNNVFGCTNCDAYTPGATTATSPGGGRSPDNHNVWYTDKSYFTTRYNAWLAAGGTVQTLVYAASVQWGGGNLGNNRKDFIRHLFAAINGSDLHPTNGTWTLDPTTQNPNTINGNLIFGGPTQSSLYGTNEFIDLSWAVTNQNGYRNDVPLTSYDVYGIYNRRGLASFNVATLGADITQFITTHPITTTSVITNTYNIITTTYSSSTYTLQDQCVSAQTTINTSYPFVTQANCDESNCVYDGWNCGINGCYSQPNGQYLSWDDCDKMCYSYSCETNITGLIQEGTLASGSYCQEFHNGVGTRIPVTGNGYDVLSYYMDQVVTGYNYGTTGYGDVIWFNNLFDNTGNNTGGVQTTTYTAVLSGPNNTTGTTGLVVEDDGAGNCETPSGGRLSRLDKVELIDYSTGVVFYSVNSNTLETFLESLQGGTTQAIPGFPSGIPGITQGMSLYSLLQISLFNSIRQFNIKIYIKGCPCSHDCDCIKLAGTGQTGTYFYPGNWSGAYHDCLDECCASLKTWTCPTNVNTAIQHGCVDPLDGSGAYATKSLCDSDCNITWDCMPASTTNRCSNVNTYIPFTLTQSYFLNQDPGFIMTNFPTPVTPLSSTYGPGGVNTDMEALIYILDQDNNLYDVPTNTVGFARGQSYLTANQQCDYPNGGGRKLGSIEYFRQDDLSTYYCMEYEMRVNGVPFMPWSTTASSQSAFFRCTDDTDVNFNPIANKKYYSVRDMLDVIEWMYSQPQQVIYGQTLKAGPCNGNSKGFSSLFKTGPNTASCNPAKPAASNGFRAHLKLNDFWEAGLFRPHYGFGIMGTSPTNNWLASWGTGVNTQGANIQFGYGQMPIIGGRNLIISSQVSIESTECQCQTSCKCDPVLGTSGFWTQKQPCLSNCCPDDICTICCRDTAGIQFSVVQLGTNCVCPPNTFQVQCGQIPVIQACKIGQTWDTELKQCIADTTLPCMEEHCNPGYKWNNLKCECEVCPEEVCSDDKTWNSSTCKCESEALPCPEEACGTNYVWDTLNCTCKCITQSCNDGYTWNSSDCRCEAIPGEVVYGCTDPTATNYNSDANTNDGSCTYSSSDTRPENQPHIAGLVLNELTHEYVRGCVQEGGEVEETYGTFSNLSDCLQSGVAGTWSTESDIDSRDTFGQAGGEGRVNVIPMCCQEWVSTMEAETTTLDYRTCHSWCISQDSLHGGYYVPLYNVVGPNTTDEESRLVYYHNITFINYVNDGTIAINGETTHESDGLMPLEY